MPSLKNPSKITHIIYMPSDHLKTDMRTDHVPSLRVAMNFDKLYRPIDRDRTVNTVRGLPFH